jgi:hypothetical protein
LREDLIALKVMSPFDQVISATLFAVGYLAAPVSLIWGWLRWQKLPMPRTAPSILSLTGFVLATVSGLLAVSTIAYAQIHRFPFYDPLLLRIFRWGALLSAGGLVFGLAGVWRPSSLRWHAPASGFAMLIFWIVAASGE